MSESKPQTDLCSLAPSFPEGTECCVFYYFFQRRRETETDLKVCHSYHSPVVPLWPISVPSIRDDNMSRLLYVSLPQFRDDVYHNILTSDLPNLLEHGNITPLTQLWSSGQISNFEYLTHLNKHAGRSFNDLMQYPVFPFILRDYTSETIDLQDSSIYRSGLDGSCTGALLVYRLSPMKTGSCGCLCSYTRFNVHVN